MASVPGRVSSPVFVGRRAELARLDAAFEAASEDAASAVAVVGGDAGVGKSRFVAELARRAEARGGLALVGACLELVDRSLPYAPVIEVLRELLKRVDPVVLDEVLGSARNELGALVPELDGERTVAVGDDVAQGRLFEHLLGVLERLGEHTATLVVLEDLHWADRSTLDLLVFLARNLRDARVLVVGTYRSDELHRRHPLRSVLAELERSGRVLREQLLPFERQELRELMAAICEAQPNDDLVEDVLARSEGNAFFAEELLAVSRDDGGAALPPTLRDVLLARVDTLPPAARTLLRTLAVIGSRASHSLLLAVSRQPEDEVLEALRAAADHQVLVVEEHGYRFRHALLSEAIYDDLLPGERVRIHSATAAALTAHPDVFDLAGIDIDAELACHWFSAHDLPNALVASVRAAESARRMYAYPEALAHYERALELWEQVPDASRLAAASLVEVLRGAALAAELSGRQDLAAALMQRALDEIDEARDPVGAAIVHERLARYLWLINRPLEELLPHNEAAVALVPPEPPSTERAVVLASLAQQLMLHDRNEPALEWGLAAIDAARAAGAREVEGHARNTYGTALAHLGDLDLGLAELVAAREIGRETASWVDVARAAINISGVLERASRYAEALDAARHGMAEIEAHGLTLGYGIWLRTHVISVLFEMGRWSEAEDELRVVDRFDLVGIEAFHRDDAHFTLSLHRGDLVGARRAVAALHARTVRSGIEGVISPYPAAMLAVADGDLESASRMLDEWVASEPEQHGREAPDWLIIGLLCAYADRATTDSGFRPRVHELRDLLQSTLARRLGTAAAKPDLAALAMWADAEVTRADGQSDPAQWARVVAHWREHGRLPHLAYARWREGEAHLLAGASHAATPALREAFELAGEMGAAPIRDGVMELARRSHVDIGLTRSGERAPNPLDTCGLTPREVEVLGLVAQGRTNRQIGESLFISVKTASVHVSNILMKLDAQNRGEAAAIARDRGLLAVVASGM